jgi:hypothetical protein
MRKFRNFVPVLLLTLSGICQTTQPLSGAAVTWEPNLPDQFFPAAILSVGGTPAKPGTSQILCDPHSSFRVRIQSSLPATHVHVEVMMDGFFVGTSSCDATLENAGQEYVVAPTPRWNTQKLAFIDQPLPATVVVSVKANGVDLGQKTSRHQIRAVNDVPLRMKDGEGHVIDRSNLFAAFVNENSPVIEGILKEALQWGAVQSFNGYRQGKASAEDVRMQIFAIWNVLQRHNVKYSNILTASGSSEDVQSQSVRFVGDAFRMSQANCVDGSVLFASVLYKIGIHPVLVKKPGHMFLGYYLSSQSQGTPGNVEFLETTMLGSGRPVALHDKPFPRHDRQWLQSTISYTDFSAALKRGNEEFQSEVGPKLRENDPRYKLIDIRKAREMGINPIPR